MSSRPFFIVALLFLANAPSAASQDVRFVANEYAFYTASKARPGLNRVVLTNTGKELHHIIMMRLPDSLDASTAFQRLMQRQSLGDVHAVGGPAAIFPGDSSVAWVKLDAGKYMVICFIPAPDKMPHAMKGMVGQLDVAGTPTSVLKPKATTVLTATEYSLDFSKPLKAGDAIIEFRNTGKQDHDYALVQLPDSADPVETARQLGRANLTMKDVRLVGGAGVLSPGRSSWTRLSLAPGHYAVVCFVSDAKDHRSHYLHGMVRTFDVK